MATPLSDKPFPYDIKPEVGIQTPQALPLFVVRKIYSIIEKDGAQTLREKYTKAFKIAITDYVKSDHIKINNGNIILTGTGQKKEVESLSKPDSLMIHVKFENWMKKLLDDANQKPENG